MARPCLLDPYKDVIISRYQNKESSTDIAKDFYCSGGAICAFLKRNNIARRDSLQSAKRRYSLNEQYFDCIDSEDKAYWLGFITADGGVNHKRLMITLKYDDYDHLYKFKRNIQATQHIYYYCNIKKKDPTVVLEIVSRPLVRSLAQYTITPNKTFTVKPPTLDSSLLRHYWRGVIDGDGCLTRSWCETYSSWKVYLCGNSHIVGGFRDWISLCGLKYANILPDRNIFKVMYHGKKLPYDIASVLYEGSSVYLDRKYQLYQKLKAEYNGNLGEF